MTKEERAEYSRKWRQRLRFKLGAEGYKKWTRDKNLEIKERLISTIGMDAYLARRRQTQRNHYEKTRPQRQIALSDKAKAAAANLLVTVASSIPAHDHLPAALAAAWLEGYFARERGRRKVLTK